MIILNFNKWGSASGKYFSYRRIYWKSKWTPFCNISLRKYRITKPDLNYDPLYFIYIKNEKEFNESILYIAPKTDDRDIYFKYKGFYLCDLNGYINNCSILLQENRDVILVNNAIDDNEFLIFKTKEDVENFITMMKIIYF